MAGLCGLAEDINQCEYYNKNNRICNAPHNKCGFWGSLEDEAKDNQYQRETR